MDFVNRCPNKLYITMDYVNRCLKGIHLGNNF